MLLRLPWTLQPYSCAYGLNVQSKSKSDLFWWDSIHDESGGDPFDGPKVFFLWVPNNDPKSQNWTAAPFAPLKDFQPSLQRKIMVNLFRIQTNALETSAEPLLGSV